MLRPNVALAGTLTALVTVLASSVSRSASTNTPKVFDSITGTTYLGNLSSEIESFFNIRYAEDTSGQNRFALPNPFYYPRNAVVNASQFGAACPQAHLTGVFSPAVNILSEDCLTLRIDRLQNTTTASSLPVMVFIHGGGFTGGQIYTPEYNPTGLLKLAEANGSPVIYAAMHYRLNIFGFASTPALAANDSLNVGLYDQRLALEWIKANIRAFGGNPDNITIFGQSAGAISIGHQINAFGGSAPVPFHRAIMESGMSTSNPGTTGDLCQNHTDAIAQLLNCTSCDPATQLACLRSVPLDVILPAVVEYELSQNAAAFSVWQPAAPSPFIPDAPSKLLSSGRFAKNIDTINGWCEDDGTIFAAIYGNPKMTTDAQVISTVTYPLPASALDPNTTAELLSLYPLADYAREVSGNQSVTAQFLRAAQMFRDTQFLCPALQLDQAMANFSHGANRQPTGYLYALNTTIDAAALALANESFLGVVHTSDLAFVFGQVAAVPTATAAQRQLSIAMAASWAAFAASGNVSRGPLALLPAWPQAYAGTAGAADFIVNVLGGPSNGTAVIGVTPSGPLVSEDLFRRCALWNSQAVLDQLKK